MSKIFVLGSVNTDYTIRVNGLPQLGQSKDGFGFSRNQGGKGANQAVACSKLGGEVYFIGCVGKDEEGVRLKNSVESYGVNTDAVSLSEQVSSGACMIIFDQSARDNILVVDRGANQCVSQTFVNEYLVANASKDDVFVTQLEINLDAVYCGLQTAKNLGMYTILNPAPFVEFDKSCLKNVDLIVPNQTEFKSLFEKDVEGNEEEAFKFFHALGVKEVVVTLGGKGSVYLSENAVRYCAPYNVSVVDTTSAGDTFIGAIAVSKSGSNGVAESMDFASKCSAITVSRSGAASSIPYIAEVLQSNLGRK